MGALRRRTRPETWAAPQWIAKSRCLRFRLTQRALHCRAIRVKPRWADSFSRCREPDCCSHRHRRPAPTHHPPSRRAPDGAPPPRRTGCSLFNGTDSSEEMSATRRHQLQHRSQQGRPVGHRTPSTVVSEHSNIPCQEDDPCAVPTALVGAHLYLSNGRLRRMLSG